VNPLRSSAHTMIIGLPPAGLHRISGFTLVIVWIAPPRGPKIRGWPARLFRLHYNSVGAARLAVFSNG